VELLSVPASEGGFFKAFRVPGVATRQDAPLSKRRSQKILLLQPWSIGAPPLRCPRQHSLRCVASHCFTTHFQLAHTPSLGIIVARRDISREHNDAIVARPRRTTAEKLRMVTDVAREPPVPASSKPDPRLINLVRPTTPTACVNNCQACQAMTVIINIHNDTQLPEHPWRKTVFRAGVHRRSSPVVSVE